LIKRRDFPERHGAAQTGRAIPAGAENWSANDVASAPSIANWPLRIMCIGSMPASAELADHAPAAADRMLVFPGRLLNERQETNRPPLDP